MKKVNTDSAPSAVGAYSQAVISRNMLYTSGQIGLDPATGRMVDGGVEKQAGQVMENLKAVLAAENLDFSHAVKATIYLMQISDFSIVNEIYAEALQENRPARSTVQVSALPLGALVEIDMIAEISE